MDSATALNVVYSDSDAGQSIALVISSPPRHGTVTTTRKGFNYRPTPGYTGVDTFSWRACDGIDTSNEARVELLVRRVNDRAGMLVALVVNDSLLPKVQMEVNRLQADLEYEGYATLVKPWRTGDDSLQLWQYLKAQNEVPGRFMAGAILIGNLPFVSYSGHPKDPTDYIYWSLGEHCGDISRRDIWVSRINATDRGGQPFPYGDEVTLIKRALDANHNYRTGLSRLPYTAYSYDEGAFGGAHLQHAANALDIWDNGQELWPGTLEFADAYRLGGELLDEQAHGDTNFYLWNTTFNPWITSQNIHDIVSQVRFCCFSSCFVGYPGGVVNQHLFTRGGGTVLAMGASQSTFAGCFQVLLSDSAHQKFRQRLATGDSWGNAIVDDPPFYADWYLSLYYGDLSLPVKASPSNKMPRVTSLSADQITGSVPLTVHFSTTANDSDGQVRLYEWFPEGHKQGMVEPAFADSSLTEINYTFTRPDSYRVRVEVVDNYLARGYREMLIVANGTSVADKAPRINLTNGFKIAPQPCRDLLAMDFTTTCWERVRIAIVSLDGQVQQTICDAWYPVGQHQVNAGIQLAPGVYAVVYETRSLRTVQRVLVVR
jgi:hypothetical protein